MKNYKTSISILFLLCWGLSLFSQTITTPENEKLFTIKENKIYSNKNNSILVAYLEYNYIMDTKNLQIGRIYDKKIYNKKEENIGYIKDNIIYLNGNYFFKVDNGNIYNSNNEIILKYNNIERDTLILILTFIK